MNVLPLETCRWAREAGFPQDQWQGRTEYHFVWIRFAGASTFEIRPWGQNYGYAYEDAEWVAAPDPLTLLDWLEAEKGWHWERQRGGRWLVYPPSWVETDTEPTADTAADLCLAILRRLTGSDA